MPKKSFTGQTMHNARKPSAQAMSHTTSLATWVSYQEEQDHKHKS